MSKKEHTMSKSTSIAITSIRSQEIIERKIYLIRGKKVMLDRDLAELYGVLTKVLNQAVKRNLERFPDDFMFRLTKDETQNWKSQIVTSNKEKMGLRKRPTAFTDLGIAMLSSVLNSNTAIQANIQIMRTFSKIREMLANNEMLRQRVDELERKYQKHEGQFKVVFEAIREILEKPDKSSKREIGFHTVIRKTKHR